VRRRRRVSASTRRPRDPTRSRAQPQRAPPAQRSHLQTDGGSTPPLTLASASARAPPTASPSVSAAEACPSPPPRSAPRAPPAQCWRPSDCPIRLGRNKTLAIGDREPPARDPARADVAPQRRRPAQRQTPLSSSPSRYCARWPRNCTTPWSPLGRAPLRSPATLRARACAHVPASGHSLRAAHGDLENAGSHPGPSHNPPGPSQTVRAHPGL
jgi:hypothetical protein